jgi:hypothetical protein
MQEGRGHVLRVGDALRCQPHAAARPRQGPHDAGPYAPRFAPENGAACACAVGMLRPFVRYLFVAYSGYMHACMHKCVHTTTHTRIQNRRRECEAHYCATRAEKNTCEVPRERHVLVRAYLFVRVNVDVLI